MRNTTDVLSNAIVEIKLLRQQNEILAAKVSVIDVFAAALGLMNRNEWQAQPDPLHAMQQHLDHLLTEIYDRQPKVEEHKGDLS